MESIEDKIREIFYFPIIKYLSFFARISLNKKGTKIIAVTGSAGKSGMVHLLNTILLENRENFKFADHANSAIGIPLSILNLGSTDVNGFVQKYIRWIKIFLFSPFITIRNIFKRFDFKYYIFEQDSDRPGEMKNSAKVLKSDIVIWLNSTITHSIYHDKSWKRNGYDSISDSIADDFAYSIRYMDKKGVAILNIDDPMVKKYRKFARGYTLEIGKESKYIWLQEYSLNGLKSIFKIGINKDLIKKELWMYDLDENILKTWEDLVKIELNNYLLPEHYFYSFASAMIFSLILNIPFGHFMASITKYKLPPGRMSVFEGINNTYILDSTYNASPQPVTEALNMISEYEKTIAILGDMRELGNESKEEHEKIADAIINNLIGKTILVGPNMYNYAYSYLNAKGYTNVLAYTTTKELKQDLLNKRFSQIDKGSIILVKGSQNTIYLESIVELLLKDKSNIEYLCRRGRIWDERRIASGL